MALTVFSEITPLPELASGTKPDADGELWNTRYTEVNLNFELLEGGSAGEFWQAGGGWSVPAGSGVTNGHVIQDEGTPLTQRANLDFIGDGVTTADGASATEVTVPSSAEEVAAASEKTTPADADKLSIYDNAAAGVLKWLSWSNLKAALKTYFDMLYGNMSQGDPLTDLSSGSATDGQVPTADGAGGITWGDESGGGGGGLTYVAKTITTANLTLVTDELHAVTCSGMTADRDIILPTPTAAGERCGYVLITDTPSAYYLIVKSNSVEIDRAKYEGDLLTFISTGTGAGDCWMIDSEKKATIGFFANRSDALSLPNATYTQYVSNHKEHDLQNNYDTSTGEFTAPYYGLYNVDVEFAISISTWAAGKTFQGNIFINGVQSAVTGLISTQGSSTYYTSISGGLDVFLNAGDTVIIKIYQGSGSTKDMYENYEYNHFAMHRVK